MTTFFKACLGVQTLKNFLQPKFQLANVPCRHGTYKNRPPVPKKRFPPWFVRQTRVLVDEGLTKDNKEFIQEVIKDSYPIPDAYGKPSSPLKLQTIEPNLEWQPHYMRTGVIAKKIGVYPMWEKDGTKISSTLFQIYDNHVIKYIPPENYSPMITKRKNPRPGARGALLVGAISTDPQLFTKQYCGLFAESGVMPKKMLTRFTISPEAALQPGTPLFASHFMVGQYVDIIGQTIFRGFQGVMKRWGFHGMPASHGVTKTHRRPGNIGSGGKKARVMPGTKMPGNMGNRYRFLKGQQIIRISEKYNVIWVRGQASPGGINSLVKIFDTVLPLKNWKATEKTPPFPTYFPDPNLQDQPLQEVWADEIHNFNDPTIMYKEE